jgi:hypothetical protein
MDLTVGPEFDVTRVGHIVEARCTLCPAEFLAADDEAAATMAHRHAVMAHPEMVS